MKIKAFVKVPGEEGKMEHVNNTLERFQIIVLGYIETVTMPNGVVLICNEEGRLNGMDYNCDVMDVPFYGPILIVGSKGDQFSDVPLTITQIRELITMR